MNNFANLTPSSTAISHSFMFGPYHLCFRQILLVTILTITCYSNRCQDREYTRFIGQATVQSICSFPWQSPTPYVLWLPQFQSQASKLVHLISWKGIAFLLFSRVSNVSLLLLGSKYNSYPSHILCYRKKMKLQTTG